MRGAWEALLEYVTFTQVQRELGHNSLYGIYAGYNSTHAHLRTRRGEAGPAKN